MSCTASIRTPGKLWGSYGKKKETLAGAELGRDLNTVQHLLRMHMAYEHDVQALSGQVSVFIGPFHMCVVHFLMALILMG